MQVQLIGVACTLAVKTRLQFSPPVYRPIAVVLNTTKTKTHNYLFIQSVFTVTMCAAWYRWFCSEEKYDAINIFGQHS